MATHGEDAALNAAKLQSQLKSETAKVSLESLS